MLEFVPKVKIATSKFLAPLLDVIYLHFKLSPNKLSVISFVIGTLGVFSVLFHRMDLALIFLIGALMFDMFDGAVARHFKMETEYGKYLDCTLDRINEAMFFIALAISGYANLKMALLAITAILVMTSVKYKSTFDPGFKRIMIIFGVFTSFDLALTIVFIANLIGFILSLVVLDLKDQRIEDAVSIK